MVSVDPFLPTCSLAAVLQPATIVILFVCDIVVVMFHEYLQIIINNYSTKVERIKTNNRVFMEYMEAHQKHKMGKWKPSSIL